MNWFVTREPKPFGPKETVVSTDCEKLSTNCASIVEESTEDVNELPVPKKVLKMTTYEIDDYVAYRGEISSLMKREILTTKWTASSSLLKWPSSQMTKKGEKWVVQQKIRYLNQST